MNKTIGIALLSAVAMAQGNAVEDADYLKYQAKYGKNPKSKADFDMRKELFKASKEAIKNHNSRPSKFKMGENKFSDMTASEKKKYLGTQAKDPNSDPEHNANDKKQNNKNRHLAGMVYEVDWVQQGVMSPVKNQGACGSCWAFVGVSVLEAMEVIQGITAEPDVLSTQHGVDCTYEYRSSGGCSGGWPEQYWGRTVDDPAPTELSYPYTGQDTDADGNRIACKYDGRVPAAQVTDYEWIGWDYYNGPLDPSVILTNLLNGPLAIFVAVDSGFQAYSSGVLDSTASCSSQMGYINHTIVLTGFREEVEVGESQDKCVPKNFRDNSCPAGYVDTGDVNFPCCGTETTGFVRTAVWTAQNSWGSDWGENGFVRIEAQNGEGVCGMNWGIEYILGTNAQYY